MPYLTDREAETIIVNVVRKAPGKLTEDDLERLIEWAGLQRLGAALVNLLIAGKVGVDEINEDGEPRFTYEAYDAVQGEEKSAVKSKKNKKRMR